MAQYEEIEEYISASAVTDIYYVVNRTLHDPAAARGLLMRLLEFVGITPVSAREIQRALELEWNDFEDAVQYSAAVSAKIDAVVTRDPSGYGSAEIPVYQPDGLLALIASK